MNRFSLLLNLAFGLATFGIGLLAFRLFSATCELAARLWQRVFRRWTVNRLSRLGMLHQEGKTLRLQVDWKRTLVLLAIPALAVGVQDFLLSPLVILIGGLLVYWLQFQARQAEQGRTNEDAETASLQLRTLMEVDHSLLEAIQGLDLPFGALKRAFGELADRLQMRQPPEQAVAPLSRLPGKVAARLAVLLANSAHITAEVQSSVLVGLEQEARRQKLLRSKMRQALALVRGTIRLLQGVAAAAAGFILLSPIWRNFFLQDVSHRTLLTTLLICTVLASLYFEYEVYQLGSGGAF